MPTVPELIKQAEGYVEDADLRDSELRESAFRETLRHLLGEGPIDGERVPFGRSLVPTATPDEADAEPSPVQIVAQELGVVPETIASVLSIDADATGISVEVPTDRLPTVKADAAREVSIVLAATNKALGREAWTSDVRAILGDYGRFDSPNFMKSVKKIPGELLTVKGRPGTKDQLLIIRRGGVEEAGRIVSRWAGM